MEIARSPEDVFDFLADMSNAAAWESSLEAIELASGQAGAVDATYLYTRRVMGMRARSTLTVTRAARPDEIGFAGAWAGPVRPVGAYTLRPASGGTLLIVTLDPEVAWWLRPLAGLVRSAFAREFRQNAQALKSLLERGRGT